MKKRIYMDYAAATPVDASVIKVMEPYFSDNFGNAGSLHAEGRRVKKALEDARDKIAQILNCRAREVIFTSGATESNNIAILGAKAGHAITIATEHPSVLETVKARGDASILQVSSDGIVDERKFQNALRGDTHLVSIAYANGEIGTIQPIRELVKIKNLKSPKALFHTDASQAAGYLDIDVKKLDVQLMTINGGKIYGPKGSGILYAKDGSSLAPIMHGGKQEYGIRPGTVDVASAVGVAEALEIADENRDRESARLTELRDYFFEKLMKQNTKDGAFSIVINGSKINRLPNNINISIHGIDSEVVMLMLDEHGIACATGSACSTSSADTSYAVRALGGKPGESLRFTLGRATTRGDIDTVIQVLSHAMVYL